MAWEWITKNAQKVRYTQVAQMYATEKDILSSGGALWDTPLVGSSGRDSPHQIISRKCGHI